MNITYTQNGDYLIPNIVIRKTKPLGHYGRLRKAYLKMHRPILSVFSSIPFYGLRFFMDWTGLYVIATALSLAWLIYTWHSKRKLEHTTDLKGD